MSRWEAHQLFSFSAGTLATAAHPWVGAVLVTMGIFLISF
jgi:hypothetical protein